jgi:hypothetical protein
MNDHPEPFPSPAPVLPTLPETAPTDTEALPVSYWLKRFLACNPFYLFSAALLLYSFYRISVDPDFLNREIARLIFSFSSLQFYEVLLVVTAIFLARRQIWYDSTLLIGLENLLLLVPFILISQGALIDKRLVAVMCLAGGLLAVARLQGAKRSITEMNIPVRLRNIGFLMLAMNTALPILYRILHEYKWGTKPDWGSAYFTNRYTWLVLVPALCGLANLLPPPRQTGELTVQRQWFPLGLFALWLAGTAAHIYCLGYVYDFSLRPEMVAPGIWMLLWTLRHRSMDFAPQAPMALQHSLFALPLLAPFIAAPQPGREVLLVLTFLNIAIYGVLYLRRPQHRLALHLALISIVSLIGGVPTQWTQPVMGEFNYSKVLAAIALGYFLLCAVLSRNPKAGIFGSLVGTISIVLVLGDRANAVAWACQGGLVFLLLHSLCWDDSAQRAARVLRILAAVLWTTHSFIWACLGEQAWTLCVAAAPLLIGYLAARIIQRNWGPLVLPISAIITALSGPATSAVTKLQTAPAWLIAVIGSFLLFALGTFAALTKHRWLRVEAEARER